MEPEKTFVPFLPMPFVEQPTRVLIHELADHSLCNRMDNRGLRLGPRVIVIVCHGVDRVR